MKKLSLFLLLVTVSCVATHSYKSPLGLRIRPHPDQPELAYDTLAYQALYKGDPEAKRLLAERDAKLKQQAERWAVSKAKTAAGLLHLFPSCF